jgi:sugar phosphate isomerase/epimerase
MHSIWSRRDFLESALLAWPALRIEPLARARAADAAGRAPGSRPAPSPPRASESIPWKLGIITDEISEDVARALDFISSYSLHYCELREMWSKNIMNLSRDDLARAKKLVDDHHLTVSQIGSPIFKYNLPQMPARSDQGDSFGANFTEKDSDRLLHQSFELARFFRTNKVRIFSYWRVADPEKAYPYVRDRLAKAAELAGQNQILLTLENEHECNIGTGKDLGRIVRDVNSPHLRGNWDPGNAAMLGEVPYPDGYEAVRGVFAHMHIKDVKRDPKGKLVWAPVGGGFIDWRGQFEAITRDHYDGTMSLETHYRRPDGNTVESTRESLRGLLKVIHETAAAA